MLGLKKKKTTTNKPNHLAKKMLSTSTLVCELSSWVTCSSLTPISKLLFSPFTSWVCTLQMLDSLRCLWLPQGLQQLHSGLRLFKDLGHFVVTDLQLFECVWTWCSSASSQWSLISCFGFTQLLVLIFFSRCSVSAVSNPLIFSFFSLMDFQNCLFSSVKGWLLCTICGMHRQKPHTASLTYGKVRITELLQKENNMNPETGDKDF